MYSRCVKRVFYSAFVRKCTDMCKHRFGVQLLRHPPLCSSTAATTSKAAKPRVEAGGIYVSWKDAVLAVRAAILESYT